MLLVTRTDVEDRLGRVLTQEESARFDAVARDVSALIYVEAPRVPRTLPVPDAVVAVASAAAISALETIPGSPPVIQESLGGYNVMYRQAVVGNGTILTADQIGALAPWRRPRIGSLRIDPTTAVAY